MHLRNVIIYLIGIPAVGKYTIAKEISRVTGAKLVDNQLINTIYSLIGYDGTDAFPGQIVYVSKLLKEALVTIFGRKLTDRWVLGKNER
ncbi:MAG TPA: hypothetical protein VGQ39_15225 [Pyrinomonadaceae bacterium]|jgi:MoxR-like ATPase|nr:hypothetical protein [Pyrinomonadaceae bacterium]